MHFSLSLPSLPLFSPIQIGFWDPRSDDDQLIVTSIQFQEELLAVGLQGGVVLLFRLNKQSAVVNIKVPPSTNMYIGLGSCGSRFTHILLYIGKLLNA